MTIATTPDLHAQASAPLARRAWRWLFGAVAAFMALLIGLPEGVAEPLQSALAWTVVAMVAVLAVMVLAKGLDLLLDSETR
ncbi:MAG: hypothetical protein Q8K71_01250 [Polaromonas sp.]|nr:hypothetical protein [Polaromonas sp.]MDP3750306.1 hypothetical protein [Polaromonas sp.]